MRRAVAVDGRAVAVAPVMWDAAPTCASPLANAISDMGISQKRTRPYGNHDQGLPE